MARKLQTAPALEPVTLAEAKAHLRVDASDENDLITSLIKAAREWCEDYQQRAYINQTWDLVLDDWPSGDCIEIPRPPLQSVTSVTYLDSDSASATMSASDYIVDTTTEPGRLVLGYGKSWPTVVLRPGGAITVRFVAGYGATADAVPAGVKSAMKLIIGHLFEHREQVGDGGLDEIPMAVEALLGPGRILWI